MVFPEPVWGDSEGNGCILLICDRICPCSFTKPKYGIFSDDV